MKIKFKDNKPVQCCFFYFFNDQFSLVVDIIRHHKNLLSRIFFSGAGGPRDYSKYCDFPGVGQNPFFANYYNSHSACTDLASNTIEGNLPKMNTSPPLVFKIDYNDPKHRYSSTDPYENLTQDLFELYHRPSLLNRLVHLSTPTLDATQLKELLPLYHEDFPLLTVSGFTLNGKSMQEEKIKGGIVHHWGWAFPDYIFLMCNKFDAPDTLLSLSFYRAQTALGIELVGGYLYLYYQGQEYKFSVNKLSTMIYYFEEKPPTKPGAPQYLTIAVWSPENPNEVIKVQIDYDKNKACSLLLSNSNCETYFDVGVKVTSGHISKFLTGTKAVLDVKGFTLP